MTERAIEFVETWVSAKIEEIGDLDGTDASVAKAWAAECLDAAQREDIPASEIGDAFDDLAAFMAGEIEEAKARKEGDHDEDREDLEPDDGDEEDA